MTDSTMTAKALSDRINEMMEDIPDGGFDSMCILEDMAEVTREILMLRPEKEISAESCARAVKAAEKRLEGYPLQYILGTWDFFGRRFKVGEGVLIPRSDTEVLAEMAIGQLKAHKITSPRIIDLCSGSGCLAVTLAEELDASMAAAVELSGDAMPYLSANIRALSPRVKLIRGDVCDGRIMDNFRDEDGEFIEVDLIVSNPPYLTDAEMSELQEEVKHEPEMALYGGNDGLKFYRIITCLWKELIKTGGWLMFEVGDAQAEDVIGMLEENGFGDIITAKDGSGITRAVGGRKL